MKASQKQQQDPSSKPRKTQLKDQKIRRKSRLQDDYYKVIRKKIQSFVHDLKNYRSQSIDSSERISKSIQQQRRGNSNMSANKREKRQKCERKSNPNEHNIGNERGSAIQPGQDILVTLDKKKVQRWWQKVQGKYFRNFQPNDTLQGLKKIVFQRNIPESQKATQKDSRTLTKSQIKDTQQSYNIKANTTLETSFEIGSGGLPQLRSYADEYIFKQLPQLQKNDNLRIIFKDCENLKIAIYQLIKQTKYNKKKQFQRIESEEEKNNQYKNDQKTQYRVKPYPFRQSSQMKVEDSYNTLKKQLQDFSYQNLQLVTIIQDKQMIRNLQAYEKQFRKKQDFVRQIDFELHLWEIQLQRTIGNNDLNWQFLQSSIHKIISEQQKTYSRKSIPKTAEQTCALVNKISNSLTWITILRSFEEGFLQKTQRMIESYKQNISQTRPQSQLTMNKQPKKKWQDTDCKICFCGLNPDSNQIIYCDQCNTSFHRACYGLRQIPNQEYYYCDSCVLKKKEILQANSIASSRGSHSTIKVNCQICHKPSFPIKNLNGHYYHVTCLMLFNYITLSNNQFVFREGITHQKIEEDVLNNQIQKYYYCQYCVSHGSGSHANGNAYLGMKIQCSFEKCYVSLHPICAYLSGCLFNVKRKASSKKHKPEETFLEAKIFCNHHAKSINNLWNFRQQIYFRRFLCNFRDSCEKNMYQFINSFKQEQQKLQKSKKLMEQALKRTLFDKILYQTKSVKKYILSKQQNMKKQKVREQQIETETGKLLERLKKKNQSISLQK